VPPFFAVDNTLLYLVSTPIGNLSDISLRALEVLKACSYILCEDTRHSRILLERYEIKTPLRSFHKFNEKQQEEQVVEDLRAGRDIALISDAGTPLIADPGAALVSLCRKEGLPISAIPGPCAVINALILSGFASPPFQFLGFLPKNPRDSLPAILLYPGTSVIYESPHRIKETLSLLRTLEPNRKVCIAREMTKHYEECLIGTPPELLERCSQAPLKGEIVLLLAPPPLEEVKNKVSSEKLVAILEQELLLTRHEAIKMAAKVQGLSKREVYKQFTND
jgi:16S rRNA (cytidine1402-2'-O)-methyltransferase